MPREDLTFIGFCIAFVAMTVQAQNTFPATGNVGIGTSNPAGQLADNSVNYGELGSGGSAGSFNWVHTSADSGWNTISSAGFNGLVVATDQTTGIPFQVSSGTFSASAGLRANHLFSVLGSGNVGIGTTSPGAKLEVNGSLKLSGGSGGLIVFPDGTVQSTAWSSGSTPTVVGGAAPGSVTAGLMLNQTYVINTNGATSGHSFKIATLVANNAGGYDHLHLLVKAGNWWATENSYIDAVFANRGGFLYQYTLRGAPITSAADLVAYNNGATVDIYITTPALNAYTTLSYTILENQEETVYTTPPDVGTTFAGALVFDAASSYYSPSTYTDDSSNITLAGNVKLAAGKGTSLTFQDGSVQTFAWNGVLGGGDYAESVDVGGDRSQYEPGDVLVIDPVAEGTFLKSAKPYETSVMGIYSTRPGVVGRLQMSDKSHMKAEVPMAMVGVVPTKVSDEGGPIRAGDLLVTSSTPGYAIKGSDRSR